MSGSCSCSDANPHHALQYIEGPSDIDIGRPKRKRAAYMDRQGEEHC